MSSKVNIKLEPIESEISIKLEPIEDEISINFEPIEDEISTNFEPIEDEISTNFEPIENEMSIKVEPIENEISIKLEPVENEMSIKVEPIENDHLELKSDILNESDMISNNCKQKNNSSDNILDRIKFSTLYELRHGNKKALLDWCLKMGLITSGYFCPKCGKAMKLREKKSISDGFEWHCRISGANGHASSRSIRTGSWFSNSRMNMCDILMITHCWVYRLPQEWVLLEMGCSQATSCDWFSYCRDVCITIGRMTMIGGKSKTVEIEETLFQRKKYKGQEVDGVYVIGGVEKGSTKCFFAVIEDRNCTSLLKLIKSNIFSGTRVISHCWEPYACFDDKNFVDAVVNDEYTFEKPDTGSSSTFGGIWRALKMFIPGFVDDFDAYLAEYAWRKNNSYAYDKMKSFIEAVKIVFPVHTRDNCE